ncbi:MAG: DUF3857 domain-containing protein [Chitinophagaceae bacterium]|nr:DUF3857 domain-containing protein [Chitinophagaceae bacterium]
MNPKILFLLLLCVSFFHLNAQVKAPSYGSVTMIEMDIKECSFDKEADAVILLDVASVHHNDERNLIMARRVRLKVLKESGIDEGNIRIPFYRKDEGEFIREIQGYVHNVSTDGRVVIKELEKNSIFTQQVNEYYSEIRIAMPDVKVGSIIEYQYRSIMKHWGFLDQWAFQTDLPTMISHYDLTILPSAEFAYNVVHRADQPIDVKPNINEGKISFEMRNVPGLRDEPYMDAMSDYQQRVIFQLSKFQGSNGGVTRLTDTWQKLNRELYTHHDFGKAIAKDISDAKPFIKSIEALSEFEKMDTICKFVRNGFSWNGLTSKYMTGSIRQVWEKRSGTNGELNLLLVNLLADAGLKVSAMLASHRSHGKINLNYPFIDKFNAVVAFVNISGNKYILDATDRVTPIGMIPFSLINTYGFVIDNRSVAPIPLSNKAHTQSTTTIVQASMSDNGIISGNMNIITNGYTKINREQVFKKGGIEDMKKYYYLKEETDIQVDSVAVSGAYNDSVHLEEKYKFKMSMPQSGDYLTINLALFTDMSKSPFVSDNRFTDVNFGTAVSKIVHQFIDVSSGLIVDAIPSNISLTMPDKSLQFVRTITYDKNANRVSIQTSLQITNPVYPAEQYPEVKEFFKKMTQLANEPLVLKKK